MIFQAEIQMNAILIGNARRAIATREHFGPIGNILRGVRNNDRRARRTRRAVDAHNFLVGYGLNSQWIGFAQVGLFRKGQLLEVDLGLYVGQIDVLKLLRVEGRTIFQGFELLFNKVELFIGELHGTAFRACLT